MASRRADPLFQDLQQVAPFPFGSRRQLFQPLMNDDGSNDLFEVPVLLR
jgi:hypothetical protein